jgi:hypothetical protein
MAALTTQYVAQAGLQEAQVAASGGGDTFTPGDRTWLEVTNGGGSPITVTLATYPDTAPWGAAIPDQTVTVTNGTTKKIGPLLGSQYANPSGGAGNITYSGVTSVTVGVYSL